MSRSLSLRGCAPVGVVLAAVLAVACAGRVTTSEIPVTHPRPARLTGEIHRPSGAGPFPALVLLHGCSGIQPNTIAWSQWLVSEGYATLVLDSFSGRGLKRVCGDSSPLTGGARAPDVFAAAEHLKTLPFVDGARIGAIGWSHGGWTVLQSSRFEDSYPGVKLRALIAFYPYCSDLAIYRSDTPLLMLLGADDNWTPAEPCRYLAERSAADGRRVQAVVYPDSHHGFDAAHLTRPTIIPDARRGAGATVAYNPKAHADAERRVKAFLAAELRP
jgi:dienelactone hydrolase